AEARARALVDQGHRTSAYGCDLTNADDVGELAARVRGDHGDRLDALVNMAGGFASSGTVAEGAVDVWHRMLAINLTTAYLSTRAFLPLVRAGRGAIVFFASEAALPGSRIAGTAPYAAAKTGVVALMQAVAQEERANGVRSNALAPGAIRTAANMASMGADKRYVEREDVASAVAWLCSEDARAVTGQVIRLS
ncbi:MAG: SDR family oxidoreductase, partial [Gemmatimonadota bacterium]|nr:SDR family oxidoreductase [Gemmatimonadota bacterium]